MTRWNCLCRREGNYMATGTSGEGPSFNVGINLHIDFSNWCNSPELTTAHIGIPISAHTPLLRKQWPRLLRKILYLCSAADLRDHLKNYRDVCMLWQWKKSVQRQLSSVNHIFNAYLYLYLLLCKLVRTCLLQLCQWYQIYQHNVSPSQFLFALFHHAVVHIF